MPRSLLVLLALLVTAVTAEALAEPSNALIGQLERPGRAVTMRTDGRVLDAYELTGPSDQDPESVARSLVASHPQRFTKTQSPELRLLDKRESLTGSHLRFRQVLDGLEIIGSEISFTFDGEGRMRAVHNRLAGDEPRFSRPRFSADEIGREVASRSLAVSASAATLVGLRIDDEVRLVYRVVVREQPLEPWEWLLDAETGAVVSRVPLFFNVGAVVFDPNPVTTLNAPALQDQDDSAAAVPPSGYVTVDLPDLLSSGPLSGPNVQILQLESPTSIPAESSASLVFQRDTDAFEDVMVYFHLDRSQRYMQSLGYVGTRRIIADAIEVDAHAASGADNSYFIASGGGPGRLYFGDGGVDDAEDADILLHEYGHAIQESIAPGAFFGAFSSHARAMGEGFGDYWAFTNTYEASVHSGRDPFCIGDWDARCGAGPTTGCGYSPSSNCLRRVDSTKTMDDYVNSDQRGTEHRNGEIWSSALRRMFMSLVQRHGSASGKRTADTLILESTFGLPSSPTFSLAARRMIEADRSLNNGVNVDVICSSMVAGKILSLSDCEGGRRGELTYFQSAQQNLAIPDADAVGISSSRFVTTTRRIDRLYVQVSIEHPYRGDIRIVLTGPDGTTVTLQEATRQPGQDINATYGLDVTPTQSLDIFSGRSAAGEWRLTVSDLLGQDVGSLVSWALLIDLEGDDPATVRPSSAGQRQFLAVVAKTPGAAGTNFVTDVRVLNRGSAEAVALAVFTPSGANGQSRFAAIRLSVAAGQVLALNDVVGSLFATSGTGNVEFSGNTEQLLITSRTYNLADASTYGQFIPALSSNDSVSTTDGPLHIPQMQTTSAFRSNLGVSEVGGGSGTVRVTLFDERNQPVDTQEFAIAQFSHIQIALLSGSARVEDAMRAEVRVVGGDARIVAYGSVVDNVSGDPIYVPGFKPPSSRGIEVPAVLHADGAQGTRWRSDLWLTNVGTSVESVTVEFYSASGERLQSGLQTVMPGGSLVIGDVVLTLFNLSSAVGHIRLTPSSLLVTTRTWTPGPTGSYGQFIAGRALGEGIVAGSPAAQSIQIENSARFRTNVGMSEVSGNPVSVRVRLYDAAGILRSEGTVTLPANGQLQANVQLFGIAELINGRVVWDVVSGSGSVLTYASVIDNNSGDPIYIPAR